MPERATQPPLSPWTRLVVVLALGLIACTTVAFFGRFFWLLELFEHFRVQYLVALLPLAVYLLLARRWLVAGVTVGALFLNALVLAPLYGWFPGVWRSEVEHVAADEVHVRDSLRFMSFNVNGRNSDYAAIREQIEAADADVVLLLEAREHLREALDGFDIEGGSGPESAGEYTIFGPMRVDLFGMLLLSRLPVTEWSIMPLGEDSIPAVEARLDWNGRELVVLGVHTHPPRGPVLSAERDAELEVVADWAAAQKDDLLVVLGDFNATPWCSAMSRFRATSGLRDTAVGGGLDTSWPAGLWPLRIPIDQALVSPELVPLERDVGEFAGSDHRPLVFTLAIE